jgi:hypothetical protein
MEDNMAQLVAITQVLANLGLFFFGVGVIWYVTMYSQKKE